MILQDLKVAVAFKEGSLAVSDLKTVQGCMDALVYKAVFEPDEARRKSLLILVKEIAKACGAIPASIQGLYEKMGRSYPGFTVPAINIRGLTYDVARIVFRKMLELNVGPVVFEIARSEIGYTRQRPLEYSTVVLAAAAREGYAGPVFIQGDHFQVVRKNYLSDPEHELNYVKGLIAEAIEAEFYNIDIDASTLVDLDRPTVREQQRPNFEMTAQLASHVRMLQPPGVEVSIGGEIGEIGHRNSTPEEAREFLRGMRESHAGKGLSKLSVQTGTSHGGIVLPDGTLASVKIDFDTLKTLSDVSRGEFGLSGAVQHGASTLPDDAFHMFPETGTSEVHLATGFQNIIYESSSLPADFRAEAYAVIGREFGKERKEGQTEEQFIYSTRKKGFGAIKQKWWDLPAAVRDGIMQELGDKFAFLFDKLQVVSTRNIVDTTVKPVIVAKAIDMSLLG